MKKIISVLPVLIFGLLALGGLYLMGQNIKGQAGLVKIPAPAITEAAEAEYSQITLVNFFASWCAPCIEEHAVLTSLAQDHGIPIYGVAYYDTPDKIGAFLEKHGNPFEQVFYDSRGKIGAKWELKGVPETFIVDQNGMIRYRHQGLLMPFDIDELILPIIKKIQDEGT